MCVASKQNLKCTPMKRRNIPSYIRGKHPQLMLMKNKFKLSTKRTKLAREWVSLMKKSTVSSEDLASDFKHQIICH
jgi:hypothetical protein